MLDAETIALACRSVGARRDESVTLAPGEAIEMPILGEPLGVLLRCRDQLAGRRIDVNLVSSSQRRKKLLVADMESTLIENEMLDELAARAGHGARVAAITRRAMNGEIEFTAALAERVGLLAGLAEAELDAAARHIRPIAGAEILVATMRAHGAFTAIVSGGFRVYTRRVAELQGFDREVGNELEIAAGRLTGRVLPPILDRDAKRVWLERFAAERGVAISDALAVGDGANDIPMLLAAGLGVAFRGKPAVAAATPLAITHGDLSALLFLQGYRRDEFVTPPIRAGV
jgi:phosphoserine phosphatase